MGSVDDQAYVLGDCGARRSSSTPTTSPTGPRQLAEMVPGLKLLALGPSDIADDLDALAAGFEPQPLVAPLVDAEDLAGISYSGGTTGKPKGIMSSYRGGMAMTTIQMAEWEWPDEVRFLVCTPLSHAGAAFFTPTLLKGGSLTVCCPASTPRPSCARSRSTASPPRCSCPRCSTCCSTTQVRPVRPLEPADRLLRRGGHLAHPARRGRPSHGADLLPVLRPGRVPDGHHRPAQGRPRSREPRAPGQLRGAGAVGPRVWPARRRRQRGPPRRARRDLRPGSPRDEGLPGQARADRRGPSPTAGCTPATWPGPTTRASSTSSTARRT